MPKRRSELTYSFVLLLFLPFIFISCDKADQLKTVSGMAPQPLQPNSAAFDFALPSIAGEKTSLANFRGKVVLLNFWATWCVPCVAEMPALERLYAMYRDQGFEIVTINLDDRMSDDKVKTFVAKFALSFTVLRDPEMKTVEAYGVTGFPESFLIDRMGRFVQFIDPLSKQQTLRVISDRPWDSKAYTTLIGQLLQPQTSPQ